MQFFQSTLSRYSIDFANDVLLSGFVNDGDYVRKFEGALELSVGLLNPVCVNSGTSALHLAVVLAGIHPNTQVITSPQTFIASSLAILYARAVPVFADINPLTGNLDPKSVESKITEKTTAILTIDWAGCPSDLSELSELSRKYNLKLIEDAAHSLGATYQGKYVGSGQVDFCCFSTQAIKNLTTVEGGILCCKAEFDYRHANKIKWFGVDKKDSPEGELGEREYVLDEVGFKMNSNNLHAAIGLGNLDGFHSRLFRRRSIAARYFTELASVPGLTLMKYDSDRQSSYWLFPVRVEKRLDFVRALKAKGVPTSVVHMRIDKHPLLSPNGINRDLVGQEIFEKEQIHIPVHDQLTDSDVSLIISTIKEGWM